MGSVTEVLRAKRPEGPDAVTSRSRDRSEYLYLSRALHIMIIHVTCNLQTARVKLILDHCPVLSVDLHKLGPFHCKDSGIVSEFFIHHVEIFTE